MALEINRRILATDGVEASEFLGEIHNLLERKMGSAGLRFAVEDLPENSRKQATMRSEGIP